MPQFEQITSYCLDVKLQAQTSVTATLSARREILTLLCAHADSTITDYRAFEGELSVSGRIQYRFLVLTEDGIAGLNYTADFSERIQAEGITDATKAYFECSVLDNEVTVEGTSLTCRTLVQTVACPATSTTCQVLTECEQAYTKSGRIKLVPFAAIEKVTAKLEEKLTLDNSVEKVLLAESYVNVTNSFTNDKVLTVEGEAAVNLTYTTQGEVVSQTVRFPFSQEVETEIDNDKQCLIACVSVKNTRIHIDIVEDVDNKELTAELTAEITLLCTEQKEIQLIEDLFSDTIALTPNYASVCGTLLQGRYDYDLAVDEQLPLDAQRVIGIINSSATVVNAQPVTGAIAIEGVLQGCVLYEKDDTIAAKQYEIPFARNIEDAYLSPDVQISSCAAMCDVQYTYSAGALTLNIRAKIDVVASRRVCQTVICDVQEGEEITRNGCAFEVCMATAGDDLWTTAKKLNMSPERISALNPDLAFPLEQTTGLVIYNKL